MNINKPCGIEFGGERLSCFRLLLAVLVLLLAWLLSGCSVYSAVPVSLQEIKHYVVEQEESYPNDLRSVVRASVAGLEELKFDLDRVELSTNRGYIAAHWKNTRVTLKFTAITPTFTRVENRILKEGRWRDYASEKELFTTVHRALDDGKRVSLAWQRAVRRLVPLHYRPESGATVVAWIRPGVTVEIDRESSSLPRWSAVTLEMNGVAYLDQQNYRLDEETIIARRAAAEKKALAEPLAYYRYQTQ
jgi:hypothetical protein